MANGLFNQLGAVKGNRVGILVVDASPKLLELLFIEILIKLTETQFRRLWMHEVEEKTLEEIAALEKVAFQSVHESIESAKKKILKKF